MVKTRLNRKELVKYSFAIHKKSTKYSISYTSFYDKRNRIKKLPNYPEVFLIKLFYLTKKRPCDIIKNSGYCSESVSGMSLLLKELKNSSAVTASSIGSSEAVSSSMIAS